MKCAIILAGGKGTRMKATCPKVMCEVLFSPMISYVVDAVKEAGAKDICVITGYKHEVLEEYLAKKDSNIVTALQEPQLGTGHAVMQAQKFIDKHLDDDILILNGDGPLMDAETINKAYDYHKENGNSITLISALVDDTNGIGHIKRDENGTLLRIVEHKDATEEEKKINESNAGCYWFNGKDLSYALSKITNNNVQNEYYLTDSLEILISAGKNAGAYVVENSEVVLGANDRKQLNILNNIMRRNINDSLMLGGVDIPCTDGVIIGKDVKIGSSTVILPNTIILGDTVIGENCTIGPNTYIDNSKIGDDVILDNCKILDSTVESGVDAGPFVKVRANSTLKKGVHIGNFVEVKNSIVGEGTKSAHLTYIGDSDVGKDVNFGCGTVTCNYDGKNKSRCTIGDGAFIGCNTNLIAPVEVGKKAYIAAGSTITDDIPGDSLAVARARQVIKENWAGLHNHFIREEKDHGEGGVFVGYKPQAGEEVVIVEDVITAGTAIRESMAILSKLDGVKVSATFVMVDRKEKGKTEKSAMAEVSDEFGFPVYSVVDVYDIIEYLEEDESNRENVDRIKAYLAVNGAKSN